MKKLKYILLILLSCSVLSACFDNDDNFIDQVKNSPNIVEFDSYNINLVGIANGSTYDKELYVKMSGPSTGSLSGDITVSLVADPSSTAVEGVHYTLNTPTLTLKKSNNYLGIISITMLSEGNSPPLEGTPEFDKYVAPFVILNMINATGESNVVATGKQADIVLNFIAPNPYAGDYDAEIMYFHPTAGGSHPSDPDFNPNDPFISEVNEKTLSPITGRKCETGFAIWGDTDICWITINSDNSISFVVDDTWPYDVTLGNPYDPSQVSHYDPDTGIIYLYYNYEGSGGTRVFWEVFTPKF